jgi:hypothetical protein
LSYYEIGLNFLNPWFLFIERMYVLEFVLRSFGLYVVGDGMPSIDEFISLNRFDLDGDQFYALVPLNFS